MSDKTLARRTELRLNIGGINVTEDVNKNLLSLTFTDNEEDKTDDLQLNLEDRNHKWIGNWLKDKTNKNNGPSNSSSENFQVGDIVNFTGNIHYVSSDSSSDWWKTTPGRAKITYTNIGSAHPYHLRAVDKNNNFISGGVYGWVDAKFVQSLNTVMQTSSQSTNMNLKVGDIVAFSGDVHYVSSYAGSNWWKTSPGRAKITYTNIGSAHPYHLQAVDNSGMFISGVYGWVDSKFVNPLNENLNNSNSTGSNTGVGIKGLEISAVIIQKNWNGDGKDSMLDCGVFKIDNVSANGPPTQVSIKGTSLPYDSKIRTQKKSKAWENINLSKVAKQIAKNGGMGCYFEADYDPLYKRKEQNKESDIVFLKNLCKKAGISLKVTAKMIVLFDSNKYEQKKPIKTFTYGKSNIISWRFDCNTSDTSYSSCHVSYTNPESNQTIEYTYTPRTTNKDDPVLEINEKVNDREEARKLAMKRLREKNKGEYKANFVVLGDTALVAGVTVSVSGWGCFDGKYLIESATHSVSQSGYVVTLSMRKVIEEY